MQPGRDRLRRALGTRTARAELVLHAIVLWPDPGGRGAAPVEIRGRTVAAAELRISAQRLDASGAATPLPIVVELPL
jgi:hypothetical protein